jgi:hypothetical protein
MGDSIAHRINNSDAITSGDMREWWFGHASGHPEVHVVQCAGENLDAHFIVGGLAYGD